MANEFKHKDPCTTLTQAEYIGACGDNHVFACQATGDLLYADSSTVLKKLARGSTTQMLQIASCKPAWTSTPSLGTTSWCNMNHAHGAGNSGGTVCANVLAGTTLKSCVVTSSLTTVAALNSGSITCGFGAIDNGSSTITTTGLISGGSLDIDNVLINGTTIGHTCDTDLITVADQSVTIAGDLAISGGCITLTGAATDIDLIDNNACALSFDASGQAGILAIDTQNCAEGVKMSGKLTVTGAISSTGALTVGACGTGHDVKFFGCAAGAYMEWDESANLLEIRGATAAGPGHLKLTTGEATVDACDVLGKIEFQAPAECGTDAIVAGANIQAVAQATFSATVNNTDLLFMTGLSGAATEKFRFTANGELGVGGANYGNCGQVLTSGGAGAAPSWACASGGGGGASALQVNDCVAVALGTGSDSKIYYDGTDTHWDLRDTGTGDLIIALEACHPSPDPQSVHIWAGSAGCVTAPALAALIIEDNANTGISILSPSSAGGYIYFGDEACGGIGGISYSHGDEHLAFRVNGATRHQMTEKSIQAADGCASTPGFAFKCNSDTGFFSIGHDKIGIAAGGAEQIRLDLAGGGKRIGLGDSDPGGGTVLLRVCQGANDDDIMSLGSSDVAHGMTTEVHTDTYGVFKKRSATTGGQEIRGYGEHEEGLYLSGRVVSTDTTKNTSADAPLALDARLKSGTGTNEVASNGNLVTIKTTDTTRFIFDKEGSGHADIEFTTYDDYNDIELMRGVHGALVPCFTKQFGRDMVYNICQYQEMGLIGRCSVHWENHDDGTPQLRGMVNMTKLSMLHHSTIIQLADNLNARIDGIETQLKALQGGCP